MRCTIPGTNIKVFARAVHALDKVGEDLYVVPNIDSLSLRSVNAGRSAYGSFTFLKTFFSYYSYTPPSDKSEGSSRCRISMKSCLPVFRSMNLLRKVENCLMRVEDNGSKLVFEMRFHHGIVKTYFLPVIESRILKVLFTKTSEMDCFNASAQVFAEVFQNFSNSQEEITIHVSPDSLYIPFYSDGSSHGSKTKSTELSLSISELNKYCVRKENSMTFSHKGFRALLFFAEATNSDIEAVFGKGKQIYFSLKNEGYVADFVLSTVYSELVSQSMSPEELRVHNSHSNRLISGESSAAVAHNHLVLAGHSPHPSQAKSNPTATPPSALCSIINEAVPDSGLNIPKQQFCASVRRGESPSMKSVQQTKVQKGRSRQTNLGTSCRDDIANDCSSAKCGASDKKRSQNLSASKHSPSAPYNINRKSFLSIPNIGTPDPCPNVDRASPPDCVDSSQHRAPPLAEDSQQCLMRAMSDMSSASLRLREPDNDSLSLPGPVKSRRMCTSTLDVNSIPGHDVIRISDSDEE